ncbi:MAG: hypothetical protein IPN88_00905 [Bacteroidetes bacterium]|nr:hypothetical protein [Bacteroidota bacterium]
MKNSSKNILMIAKWYPFKEDPQFGVFIQKHAKAIAIENKVAVLYASSNANQNESYVFEINQEHNLLEIIISFKKNESVFPVLSMGIDITKQSKKV